MEDGDAQGGRRGRSGNYNFLRVSTCATNLYDTLLAMLKGLPKQQIEIIESPLQEMTGKDNLLDINQFSGTIDWPIDGLTYQQQIRTEWDRDFE